MTETFNYIDVISMKLIKSSLYDIFKRLEDKKFRKSNELKIITGNKDRQRVDSFTFLKVFRILRSSYDNHVTNDYAMLISMYNWCGQYNTLKKLTPDDEPYSGISDYVFNKDLIDNYDKEASAFNNAKYNAYLDTSFERRYPNFVEHYRQHGNLPIIEDLMSNPLNYSIRTVSIKFENNCNAFTYVMQPFLGEDRKNYWKNTGLSWYEINQSRHKCVGTRLVAITPISIFRDPTKKLSDVIRATEFIGILCDRDYMDYYHYEQNKYRVLTNLHEYMCKLIGPKMEFDSLRVPYQE